MPLTFEDIQDDVINSLKNENKQLKGKADAQEQEISELRSLLLLLIHSLGGKIIINQLEHNDFIKKIIGQQVGLVITPDITDDNIVEVSIRDIKGS